MTTGEKSRTADHPTGIGRSRTISRPLAGSGNRGQHACLRVAVVGSTTIRNVPFVHSVFDLCPSQLQRSFQVSNPCALPVVKSSGTAFPKVTLSRSCWLLQTRSDGSGGTLSQPFCNQLRASPRPKLRHLNMSWLRKNLSTTKNPRTKGSLRKKTPEIDGDRREVAEATPSRTGYPWEACSCTVTGQGSYETIYGWFACYAHCCAWCWY